MNPKVYQNLIGRKENFEVLLQKSALNEETRTIPLAFIKDTYALRRTWFGSYVLVFQHQDGAYNLDRMNNGAPLLFNHDSDQHLGVLSNARIEEDGVGRCDAMFGTNVLAKEKMQDVKDGILSKVSWGFDIDEAREMTPEEMSEEVKNIALKEQCDVYLVTKATGLEVSLVTIPQIDEVGVGMNKEINNNEKFHSHSTKGYTMTPEELKAEQERLAKEAKEQLAKDRKAQQEALAGIYAASEKFIKIAGVKELRDKAIEEEWDEGKFHKELNKLIPDTVPSGPAPGAELQISTREVTSHWRKRAVAHLRYMYAQATGQGDVRKFTRRLEELNKGVTPAMLEAERKEAFEIVQRSKVSEMQKERLYNLIEPGEKFASLTEGNTGTYVVPTPLLAQLFVIVEEWGQARNLFFPVPMTSATLKLANIATKCVAYWLTTQGTNITASDLALGSGALECLSLAAVTGWSNELDEDAAVALLPITVRSMAEGIYKKEDLAGFIGDGSGTYGGFTGLLHAASNVYTLDAGKTAFTDPDLDDYRKTIDKLSLARRRGAMWIMHPDLISELDRRKDTTNNYLYRRPADGNPATLWGYPIAGTYQGIPDGGIEAMPALSASAAATKFAAFGNPLWYAMGMRKDVDILMSKEGVLQAGDGTISINAFQGNLTLLRALERVAFEALLTDAFVAMKTAAA